MLHYLSLIDVCGNPRSCILKGTGPMEHFKPTMEVRKESMARIWIISKNMSTVVPIMLISNLCNAL